MERQYCYFQISNKIHETCIFFHETSSQQNIIFLWNINTIFMKHKAINTKFMKHALYSHATLTHKMWNITIISIDL